MSKHANKDDAIIKAGLYWHTLNNDEDMLLHSMQGNL